MRTWILQKIRDIGEFGQIRAGGYGALSNDDEVTITWDKTNYK
ncbi:hypothetical protein ACTQ56_10210 [[Clostridium] aminophilum]